MNDSLDVSTIVFAALAVFVVWKLRSVLGTRTGEERPPFNPFVRRNAAPGETRAPQGETGKVIPLPGSARPAPSTMNDPDRWKGIAEPGTPLAEGLDRIVAADPSFQPRGFIDGAKGAYEIVLAAFARGDRDALKGLLAKDVLDGFATAISERESRGETMTHTMVALDSAVLTQAQVSGNTAQVAVRFESQQVNTVRDRAGGVVGGGSEAVGPVLDEWTFARVLSSRDPNWTLIATSAE